MKTYIDELVEKVSEATGLKSKRQSSYMLCWC